MLTLAARLIERSPALTHWLGPVPEPDNLDVRLADAAVVAARMAHEFDNLLVGVVGFTDLSIPLVPAGSQVASFLAELAKAGQRGQDLTRQCHELKQCAAVKPQPGSVGAAIKQTQAALAESAPKVTVAVDLPADLPMVAMAAGPLGIVFGHLLRNAAESMPKGGTVSVSAEVAAVADARGFVGKVPPGPCLTVTIRDAGPGIPAGTHAKLFREPFETTKARHRGLGLAVVYRCVTAHGGGIRVDLTPPGATGAVVRLALPLAPIRHGSLPTSSQTPVPPVRFPQNSTRN